MELHVAPHGEAISGSDRLVVSPTTGVFEPVELNPATATSPFAGRARELIAWRNERVQKFQPVLWLDGVAA